MRAPPLPPLPPATAAACDRARAAASIESQPLPDTVHTRNCSAVHLDHRGPGPVEALRRPLPRRVDPHLAPVVRQTRGVIERIDRPHGELDIALRIDVVR